MSQSQQLSSNFLKFIKRIFLRQISAFIIILGRRGSGKTDLALLIAQILYEQGIVVHVATNIKIYKSPFPITEIDNLDDLKDWAKANKGRKLFLFDEIAKAMPRRRPMASLTVDLLNEFQILRKHKLSVVATTITEKQTDGAILDPSIIDGYFTKPNWKNPKIALYYDILEEFTEYWYSMPKTSIHFDTYSSAPFKKHGKKRKPRLKTEELNNLWDLTHGVTSKALNLQPQQVARLWRKYVKEKLEAEHHTSQ